MQRGGCARWIRHAGASHSRCANHPSRPGSIDRTPGCAASAPRLDVARSRVPYSNRRSRRAVRGAEGLGGASGYWSQSALIGVVCGRMSLSCRRYIRHRGVVIPLEYFGCAASFKPVQAAMPTVSNRFGAIEALRAHWPEYLMEGAALGMFMVSACVFGAVLEHVAGLAGRVLGGIAMGLTAVAIISSPWGQRSGAHMNPAVTVTFLCLGKIAPWDAFFYVIAQFAGGVAGVLLAA